MITRGYGVLSTLRRWVLGAAAALYLVFASGAAPGQVPEQCPADAAAALPDECKAPIAASSIESVAKFLRSQCQVRCQWPHDASIRQTGPSKDSHGSVHGYVFNFYSPGVFDWLRRGRPAGGVPDGSLIVKQMYNTDKNHDWTTVSGWTIMVKQRSQSFDGWYWGYVDVDSSKAVSGRFFDPSCIACHASADNRELTFATIDHVGAGPVPEERGKARTVQTLSAPHAVLAEDRLLQQDLARSQAPTIATDADLEPLPKQIDPSAAVRVGPAGPTGFVTSDICGGCHDASNLAFNIRPNMAIPADHARNPKLLNVSPFSEWGSSLMALSGRDPVFQAQLESEKALHPELADFIDDTCYAYHGAMGQRQWHQDQQPGAFFTHATFMSVDGTEARYGALGRDGVSCGICHRMVPDGIGFDGHFNVAEPSRIFGPYEKPVLFAMRNAIGIVPEHSELVGESKLCGSCHNLETPVLEPGKKYSVDDAMSAPKSHEQSTYFEWLNSDYRTGVAMGPGAQPSRCQDCHMPKTLEGRPQPLAMKIANIEDETFRDPDGRTFRNTAALADITLPVRKPFSRHTLTGANVFVLEMFKQFPDLLGVRTADPNLSYALNWVDALTLGIQETAAQAAHRTAKVEIGSVRRSAAGALETRVSVTNLAGHKIPSGVGFRRAFIEFVAYDRQQNVVWSSGRSSDLGVLLDNSGRPLTTEFSDTDWQPHHSVISDEHQAQIYEERGRDAGAAGGKLTTSFFALATVVKDNRLMPKGWRSDGPEAERTMPVGVDARANPGYYNGEARDEVVYRVPSELADSVTAVTATLYYQTIPPYYLAERERTGGKGPATRRLGDLASWIKYEGTPVSGWKLSIASARAAAPKARAPQ